MQATDCPVGVNHKNCTVHQTPGGLTYSRLRQRGRRAGEHYDGEILAQTMWQLRDELRAAHEPDEADEPHPLARLRRPPALAAGAQLHRLPQRAPAGRQGAAAGRRRGADLARVRRARDGLARVDRRLRRRRPGGRATSQARAASRARARSRASSPTATPAPRWPAPRSRSAATGGRTARSRPRPTATAAFASRTCPAGTYPHLFTRRAGYATQVDRDVEVHGDTRFDVRVRRNWADTYAGAVIAGTTAPRFNGCRPAACRRQPVDELGLDARQRRRQLLGRHPAAGPGARHLVRRRPHAAPTMPETEMDAACPLRARRRRAADARADRGRLRGRAARGSLPINQALDATHAYRMTELRPARRSRRSATCACTWPTP